MRLVSADAFTCMPISGSTGPTQGLGALTAQGTTSIVQMMIADAPTIATLDKMSSSARARSTVNLQDLPRRPKRGDAIVRAVGP